MEQQTVEKINKENLYTGIKVLLKYISQYKKEIITLSVMGILSAIGNGFVPYIVGRFFDVISSTEKVNIFNYFIPVYLALLILWALRPMSGLENQYFE